MATIGPECTAAYKSARLQLIQNVELVLELSELMRHKVPM